MKFDAHLSVSIFRQPVNVVDALAVTNRYVEDQGLSDRLRLD